MSTDPGKQLTERIIGLAIEVHRVLGPGLIESVYEHCLCHELRAARLAHARQVSLPVIYKGQRIAADYRMDIVVENTAVVEVKAVEHLLPVHQAQLLTYLKIAKLPLGPLLNFNTAVLKDGIRRFALRAKRNLESLRLCASC
jgi:GxxExxY protein